MKTLRERDGQLRGHWYIACLSHELTAGAPIQRILYDTPYALFRDESGRPAALLDRCLHRGTLLSRGRCRDGKLQCPYHGWIYDARGKVCDVPSERVEKPSVSLPTLPVVEQDGCVWVWLGDTAPEPGIPAWRFPHRGEKGWDHYFMITDFDNEVTNLVENFMDVPHTVFVHRGWFRSEAAKRVPFRLDARDGRVLVTYRQPSDSIGFTRLLINPRGKPMEHTDEFIFPNLTRVDYRFGDDSSFIINSQCTPVSTLKTRVYTWIAFRVPYGTKLLGPLMRYYTRQVIDQDVKIMKNQGDAIRLHSESQTRLPPVPPAHDEVHAAIEKLRELGITGLPVRSFERVTETEFWI